MSEKKIDGRKNNGGIGDVGRPKIPDEQKKVTTSVAFEPINLAYANDQKPNRSAFINMLITNHRQSNEK